MDRREAMLRELKLYPLWVRREVAAPAMQYAVEIHQPPAVNEAPPAMSIAESVDELPVFVKNELPLQLIDSIDHSAGLSLREFQSKVAAGPLAEVGWPELKQKIHDCNACGLRAGCTQTVAGCGNEQAEWMFIGEAPGVDEDAAGEPFVGHAGRLLNNMLRAIKLNREQVYIANVIKCRPPEDRHPHVGEIAACLPYLQRQIELVKPRLIVALGKTAASALLDTDATIASLRGQVHEYKGIPVVVSFHPAYLLRSPSEKARAWKDLCLAVQTMQ